MLTTSPPSPPPSTADPARPSTGNPPPRPSTSYCRTRQQQAVLRPPLEPKQYTALRFTQRLIDAGAQPSMGSVGDSFDNALAESFFSTLKVELVYRTSFRTREEAELELFRYIDGWFGYAGDLEG